MQQHLKRVLIATSVMAALSGTARAADMPVTFPADGCISLTGEPYGCWGGMHGGGSLVFSDLLVGALSIAAINVAAVSPALLTDADVMSVTAPIHSLSAIFNTDTQQFTATNVSTQGGAVLVASAVLPSGKKNSATTGGSLSLTGIQVDLTTQGIYATLTGANGIGTRDKQLIWHYGAIEGATRFPATSFGFHTVNRLSELTITTEAFDLFAQSLGLTAFGKNAMASITDYGVMDATLGLSYYMDGTPSNLPEPSAYVLVGIGLVGMAVARRSGHGKARGQ